MKTICKVVFGAILLILAIALFGTFVELVFDLIEYFFGRTVQLVIRFSICFVFCMLIAYSIILGREDKK